MKPKRWTGHKATRILFGKPERSRPLGRKWEGNIKVDLKNPVWGMDWIYPA